MNVNWKIFESRIIEPLERTFSAYLDYADDHLFELSTAAGPDQDVYFDAMLWIRANRQDVRDRFLGALREGIARFAGEETGTEANALDSLSVLTDFDQGGSGADALEIMDDDSMEMLSALHSIHERGLRRHREAVYVLEHLLAKAKGLQSLSYTENPISPYRIGAAFLGAFGDCGFFRHQKSRIVLLKWFETQVIDRLDELYDAANSYLLELGYTLDRRRPVAVNNYVSRITETRQMPAGQSPTAALPDLAEFMRTLQMAIQLWRGRSGIASMDDLSGSPIDKETLCQLIDEAVKQCIADGDEVCDIHAIKRRLKESLHEMGYGIAREDEDAIDIAAFIFDFFLQDNNLPEAVKELVSLLQPPYLKMMIRDRSVISNREHPARQFLNRIGQVGLELSSIDNIAEDPVYLKLKELVARVVGADAQGEPVRYDAHLEELERFLNDTEQKNRIREARIVQSLKSQERFWAAKTEAARIIRDMIGQTETGIPPAIEKFLSTVWTDNLAVGWLNRESHPDIWKAKKEMNDFFFYLVGNDKAEKRIGPLTAAQIREKLECLKHDLRKLLPEQMLHRSIVGMVEEMAEARIRGLIERNDRNRERILQEIRGKIDEIQRFIDQTAENVDDIGKNDFAHGDDDYLSPDKLFPDEDVIEHHDPEALAAARKLDVGDWVFLRKEDRKIRAKVAWISRVLGKRFLIDRHGDRVAALTLKELADGIADGRIELLEKDEVPLIDRALSTLMNNVKGLDVMDVDG